MYLARVLNFLKISNFKFWRRFRQPISKKNQKQQKDHRLGTKPCKIHGNTYIWEWRRDGGRRCAIPLRDAMRRGRQAGRSDNDEERRNSEKRGEWRRARIPDLLRLGIFRVAL